jgi:hypothetical protein
MSPERIIINGKGKEKTIRGAIDPEFSDKKVVSPDKSSYLHQMIHEQKMRREHDPGQNEATSRIKTRLSWVGIFMTGDWHIGSERTDYQLWDKHQRMVYETDGLYECIVGDERDNFVIPKYVTGRDEHLINPHQQAEYVEWHLKRMDKKGKILARTGGNHDGWTWMMSGIHLEHYWYREMKSPLMENGGFLHLFLNDMEYTIYLHHGISLFNSNFNPNHATKRAFEFQGPFDAAALGHHHTAEIAHGYRWNDSYQKDYVQFRVGTYKLDDQYARSKQLGKGQPPGVTLLLNTKERKMIPLLKLDEAIDTMEGLNEKN